VKATAPRHLPRAVRAGLLAALAAGVVLRCWTASPLWLDESLSVNIARVPLSQLHEALRQDGAPPLFYLLLHGWMTVFGSGDVAVRALPELLGLLALPLVWLCGRRLGGREVAWTSLLLVASSPFAVRYATETRMYSLVLLLSAAGYLALARAWEAPTPLRLAGVSLVTAALLYTHYWSVFLLAAVAGLLLALRSRSSLLCLGAVAAGGALFLPWLPTFLFQAAHTGAPWARPAGYDAVLGSVTEWAGGDTAQGQVLSLVLCGLALLAVFGRRRGEHRVVLERPARRSSLALLVVAVATMVLGVTAGLASGSAYASRYSTVAFLPALLLAARGARALPTAAARWVVAGAVVCGLVTAAHNPVTDRTDADVIGRAIDRGAQRGDVVAYCPDQLGPAVSRYLHTPLEQRVFPTGGGPQRIDWVDYAARNRRADVTSFAQDLQARAGSGRVWLVYATGYRTFGQSCQQLSTALSAHRTRAVVVSTDHGYFEHPALLRFDP
jgi:mannosyltransferase